MSPPKHLTKSLYLISISLLGVLLAASKPFELLDVSGRNIHLGTLGGLLNVPNKINNNGQIVGYCINDTGDARATLFDISGNGSNIDLNTLIDPASGWILNYAYSINDNGVIVGNGSKVAFLLEPTAVFTDSSLPPGKY